MVRPHFFIIPNSTAKNRLTILSSNPYDLNKIIVLFVIV